MDARNRYMDEFYVVQAFKEKEKKTFCFPLDKILDSIKTFELFGVVDLRVKLNISKTTFARKLIKQTF